MANEIVVRDRDTLASLLAQADFVERVKPYLPGPRVLARYVSGILSAAARQPKILNCTKSSLMRCAISMAELNLSTGAAMPEAHIVPYGTEAVLIPDYRGLIKIACRGGKIRRIRPEVVRRGDKFKITSGNEPKIEHEPQLDGGTSEQNYIGVYAVAYFADGTWQHEWMTKAEVDAIRSRSRATTGPWSTDYIAMAKKTVIRRLCKYLPLADEDRRDLDTLLSEEDRAEGWITVEATEVVDDRPKAQRLADKFKGKDKPADPPTTPEPEPEPAPEAEPEPASASEVLVIQLAQSSGASESACRERLEAFCKIIHKKALAKMSPAGLADLAMRIKKGEIRVEEGKDNG